MLRMKKWMSAGFVCVGIAACGGSTQPAETTGTTAPTATAAATATATAQSGPPAQCTVLSSRIDTFNADTDKMDPKTAAGLTSLGAAAMSASTDVGAAKVDGDLAAIAHDTSAYLADTSKKVVELGTILQRIIAAGQSFDVESIKKCVGEPSKKMGAACKGKTTGDCPKVMAALDAWGGAKKDDVAAALAQFRALHVTDAAVKAPVAEVVKCTAPLANAFDEIDRNKARLKELDTPDTREADIDKRFKTVCGRGLFTK
jgi:hypothetical protein